MLELAIVRHGETDWNKQGRLQGHRDIPLNRQGLHQAACVAQRLADERWDAVVSSDLQRAFMTAQTIAQAAGIQRVSADSRLRERSYGLAEGTTEKERIARWGDRWRKSVLGLETDESVSDRGMSFLSELVRLHEGKRLVVVTHGGWIRVMFARLFPELPAFMPGNTSLHRIVLREGVWRCDKINCTAHLVNE